MTLNYIIKANYIVQGGDNMEKYILVCCASSIATSTIVATTLKNALDEKGIKADIKQCSFAEVSAKVKERKPDLILSTGKISEVEGVPIIVATSFLTGIGLDSTISEIENILKT